MSEPFTCFKCGDGNTPLYCLNCAGKMKAKKSCTWTENDCGFWDTKCGEAFRFIDGDPAGNKYKYCPYCGRPIDALPYVEPKDEERPQMPTLTITFAQE